MRHIAFISEKSHVDFSVSVMNCHHYDPLVEDHDHSVFCSQKDSDVGLGWVQFTHRMQAQDKSYYLFKPHLLPALFVDLHL